MNSTNLLSADSVAGQFLRYLVVGGIAFVVDFGVLVLCKESVGLHYLESAAIAFLCGLVVNYLLSITWVFSAHALADRRTEFVIFSVIGILGLGWNELFMYLGTGVVGLDYRLSKIVSVALVLLWNFGMRKWILFSRAAA